MNRRRFLSQTITSCALGLLPIKTFKIMAPKGIVVRPSSYSGERSNRPFTNVPCRTWSNDICSDRPAIRSKQSRANPITARIPAFRKPEAGGPAMAENPLVALDLPLKVIAWQDAQHQVWVAYNDAEYIKERYSLPPNQHSPFALDGVIDSILKKGS
jgi:hypothetical protein